MMPKSYVLSCKDCRATVGTHIGIEEDGSVLGRLIRETGHCGMDENDWFIKYAPGTHRETKAWLDKCLAQNVVCTKCNEIWGKKILRAVTSCPLKIDDLVLGTEGVTGKISNGDMVFSRIIIRPGRSRVLADNKTKELGQKVDNLVKSLNQVKLDTKSNAEATRKLGNRVTACEVRGATQAQDHKDLMQQTLGFYEEQSKASDLLFESVSLQGKTIENVRKDTKTLSEGLAKEKARGDRHEAAMKSLDRRLANMRAALAER